MYLKIWSWGKEFNYCMVPEPYLLYSKLLNLSIKQTIYIKKKRWRNGTVPLNILELEVILGMMGAGRAAR